MNISRCKRVGYGIHVPSVEKISQVIILFGITRGIVNQVRRSEKHMRGLLKQGLLLEKRGHFLHLMERDFGTGKPAETGSRDPKIQALLHEIINDDQNMDVTSQPSFAVKQNSSPARRAIPQKSPKPSVEVIAEVFPSELPTPPSEVVAAIFQEEPSFEVEESPPRTKGDITGFSDGEDDEHSDIDESIDNSSDEIEFLPATVDGLGKRFVNCGKNLCEKRNTNIGTR